MSTIERLKYLNLEVSTGKVVNTKENIDIRCRVNPTEGHSWHTSHNQLNIIVDLIYNFFISWGKRQDILDNKLENILAEYQNLTERYYALNNKIDIILQKIEEAKGRQYTVCKNNDYIKEEVLSIGKNLSKASIFKESSEAKLEILEVKKLAQEIKTLIIS